MEFYINDDTGYQYSNNSYNRESNKNSLLQIKKFSMKLKRGSLGNTKGLNLSHVESFTDKRVEFSTVRTELDTHVDQVGEKVRQLDYISSA